MRYLILKLPNVPIKNSYKTIKRKIKRHNNIISTRFITYLSIETLQERTEEDDTFTVLKEKHTHTQRGGRERDREGERERPDLAV